MHYDTISLSRHVVLYKTLLSFYPYQYRKRFGAEMLFVFEELYKEEIAKNGKTGPRFWFSIIRDATQSIIVQHLDSMKKQGIRKYLQQTLHINKYNLVGFILLLPILIVSAIDLISRIMQGNLFRYNRATYAFLSHSFLYKFPVIFIWVVLFPVLAVAINIIPLITKRDKKHINILSVVVLIAGLSFLAMIKLHDFAPCVVHGLFKVGIGQLPHVISVCRKA